MSDLTVEKERAIRRMWADNVTVVEMCRTLECGDRQLRAWRRELGIGDRPAVRANRNTGWEVGAYWKTSGADEAFAKAMAGREFDSLKFKSGTPVRTSRVMPEAEAGASSLTLV